MDFITECEKRGFLLTEKQVSQFNIYYQFLIEKNKVMNLTAITEESEVYLKHFIDSLELTKIGELDHKTLLDVGSGAGFPSIPLKILLPSLKVTIIDALQKRILFLEELLTRLDILDVTLIHGRAEEFNQREAFDIVTGRAVAKMNILLELCLPFVKIGGIFVAMKSIHYEEELALAHHAILQLGGSFKSVIAYELDQDLTHALILIEKVKKTDSIYPRNFGMIKKKPL